MASQKTRSETSLAKTHLYKVKNELYDLLEEPKVERREIRAKLQELNYVMGKYLLKASDLGKYYEVWGEVDKLARLNADTDRIEEDYHEAEQEVKGFLQARGIQRLGPGTDETPNKHAVYQAHENAYSQQRLDLKKEIQQLSDTLENSFKEIKAKLADEVLTTPKQQHSEVEQFNTSDKKTASESLSRDVNDHKSTSNLQEQDPVVNSMLNPSAQSWSVPRFSQVQTSTPYQHSQYKTQRPIPAHDFVPSQQQHLPAALQTQYPEPYHHDVVNPQQAVAREPYPHERREGSYELTNNQQKPLDVSFDSSRLLTRVPVPKFKGEKRHYESWKAAFTACVDSIHATPEYKLLRLRDCLEGEPQQVIEGLGHSAAAYNVAKERLERKYGGKRRQIIMYFEELDKLKPIRDGNARDVEKLAEFLDVLVVNLQDAGQENELRGGSLYIRLQKKLSESLLSQFNRWIFENNLPETVESLRVFVNREADFMMTASETIRGLEQKQEQKRDRKGSTFVTTSSSGPNKRACPVCEQDHGLWACDSFKKMTVNHRWDVVKENKRCFGCLGGGHHRSECTRSRECGIRNCRSHHNRLLHEDSRVTQNRAPSNPQQNSQETNTDGHDQQQEPNNAETQENAVTLTSTAQGTQSMEMIALRTVPVNLRNGNKIIKVNALLDEASTRTYLNEDVAAELGLYGDYEDLKVNVLNDQAQTLKTSHVEFTISSMDQMVSKLASGFTVDRVTGNLEVVDWNKQKSQWRHLEGINFPRVGPRPTVDLLIGVDHADLMYSEKDIMGKSGEPIARLTPLGWTCVGGPQTGSRNRTNFTFMTTTNDDIDKLLRKYWDIEEPTENTQFVKADEKHALAVAAESIEYKNCHYSIALPWKQNKEDLTNNYRMACYRLENTEKRLKREPEVAEAYTEVFRKYEDKGYIRKVPNDELEPGETWYLPHFPVVKPDRSTTKVRIVFDASAKHQGLSLNDAVVPGPKLQNELFDVLLRFRRKPIALMCDISEMYLQISLKQEDQAYHRFLWRDLDTHRKPDIYEFNRVVFGVNSSPFMAQYIAQTHARKNEDQLPLAAQTVLHSTYMDDSIDSVCDVKTGIELRRQLTALWESAGMHPRKWVSNAPEVLYDVPEEDRAVKVDLDRGEVPSVKTLGVFWSPKEDCLKYQISVPGEDFKNTKRDFLKRIATLFDPLGLLQPFTVRAKIVLQEMWMKGLEWDEQLDHELSAKALLWFSDLPKLPELEIRRCLVENQPFKIMKLHIFVDASQEAYGAAAYLRVENEDGTTTSQLIASKAKVAPLNATSIPRLELMAAVVGLHLAERVGTCLDLESKSWTFWSDSVDVLYWIRGRSRSFKPFVANRVGEIQKRTSPEQWRHVPTQANPADLLTRGLDVSTLINTERWWIGPSFLTKDSTIWPKNKILETASQSEVRTTDKTQTKCSTAHTLLTSESQEKEVKGNEDRLEPQRFSNWEKMTRIHARVIRFVDNCCLPPELRRRGAPQPEEIYAAEIYYMKMAQKSEFEEDIKTLKAGKYIPKKSKLGPLNPFLDEDGILRCDGRLRYARSMPWEARYPIILPKSNPVTKLLVKKHHDQSHHAGTNHVLADLSSRFWILSAREAIRAWERECSHCQLRKAQPGGQVMAPLPEIRSRGSLRAFTHCSVDYGGPFLTKQGRGKVRTKRYLCLFTCLETRAVHLELAYSLSTDSYLNAFYRMVARRGLPQVVYSDNGTNFVGAANELQELTQDLDKTKIQASTATDKVKWHFNPPSTPHFSGVHEIMIKAAKRAMHEILGDADVTDEELLSAITGAEGLLNSRPLTYQSSNAADITPLTPNHFLHGQMGGKFAPEVDEEESFNPRKRWRRVQELVRHFWRRWMREWLPALSPRKKWQKLKPNLKVGDVVLVMSPDGPRGKWPLGRVEQTFPGADGHTRVVEVRVSGKVMRRPVVKICPLEF